MFFIASRIHARGSDISSSLRWLNLTPGGRPVCTIALGSEKFVCTPNCSGTVWAPMRSASGGVSLVVGLPPSKLYIAPTRLPPGRVAKLPTSFRSIT